ncbi:hypothetical protein BV25DRAFT_1800078 [Artomyces pyxidatus]|uniref:Uncharacterized protein n=1 Tax=Artomyces pyxidatus TaxID=48021 RepID=A0ACB8T8X9_9AGAM|nr:hypothetical protein BV25DRAFT_1800078 [Artomyces pyxidatus]
MSAVELDINDDHPLALELTSLRAAVARFQHEAHASALKLQRHSLDATLALERAQAHARENTALRAELAALHAHPDAAPHPAALQAQELTVALRRLSDKLTHTEGMLLARTAELAGALGDRARARHEVDAAYALAARARAREEEGRARERELERRVRAVEEEGRMADRAVREYADLVRNLERRQSASSPPANGSARHSVSMPLDGLRADRAGLQQAVEEFGAEAERLEAEIARLHGELEVSEARYEAQQKAAEEDRTLLAQARTELDKLSTDDSAAAKMVSRYMKFSQSTTNSLQRALDNLKARHSATISTLELRVSALETSLASERRQSDRLRDVLDELTEQLARESYGRRREVSLRLAVVGREDGLAEALRRWVRRARETLERSDRGAMSVLEGFEHVVDDAVQLLALVDGVSEVPARADGEDWDSGMGSVARILAAQDAVKTLVEELQVETEKRMKIERELGRCSIAEDGTVIPPQLPTSSPLSRRPSPSSGISARVDAAVSPIFSPSSPVSISANGPVPETSRDDESLADSPPILEPLDTSSEVVVKSIRVDEVYQPSPRFAHEQPSFVGLQTSRPSSQADGLVAFPQGSPQLSPNPSRTASDEQDASSEASAVAPSPFVQSPSRSSEPPSLLTGLEKIKTRYDTLQRAFRDCHLALRDLKQNLPNLPSSSALPPSLLHTALSRLDDFNEDARVELEIRVADEERISRGYATLLSVPGAIASPQEAADVERAVLAFVDGTDTGVARAQSQFTRKLDDLEHDVAAVKRAIHATPEIAEDRPHTPEATPGTSWTSLAAGFFTPSRPASPAAPTFGTVMTSPRPRRVVTAPSPHARVPSGDAPMPNPFAALGLRIPMPEHIMTVSSPNTGVRPPAPRARTTSGLYMLGLGMRSGSFAGPGAAFGSSPRRVSSMASLNGVGNTSISGSSQAIVAEAGEGGSDDMDSDIE